MEFDLFEYIAEHRHQEIHVFQDRATQLHAVIAIHSTHLGPALGGTRLWHYATSQDAFIDALRLAEGMTFKAAAVGLPLGGGKAVILTDGKEQDAALRAARFEAFGGFVESLGGRFITAEDIGTTPDDVMTMHRQTTHVVGLPTADGGSGDPSPMTAHGVLQGMQAMIEGVLGKDSFDGITVAIQGLGKVGMSLAQMLKEKGAIITATDIRPAVRQQAQETLGITIVEPDAIYDVPCTIFAPCALGGVLNDQTIPRLTCSIIAGSANNQLAEERHAEVLRARGISYAVDYIINAGGLINVSQELEGYHAQRAIRKVDHIYNTIKLILKRSAKQKITPSQAAWKIAAERLGLTD